MPDPQCEAHIRFIPPAESVFEPMCSRLMPMKPWGSFGVSVRAAERSESEGAGDVIFLWSFHVERAKHTISNVTVTQRRQSCDADDATRIVRGAADSTSQGSTQQRFVRAVPLPSSSRAIESSSAAPTLDKIDTTRPKNVCRVQIRVERAEAEPVNDQLKRPGCLDPLSFARGS
ncbi:hypothetical protein L1887_48594 [Cichorium endivia]|nr:hypothetical protein L1887_48594 [Cichorium endivia]